jgi:hypothetical protein
MNKNKILLAALATCVSSGAFASTISLQDAAEQAHNCVLSTAIEIKNDALNKFKSLATNHSDAPAVTLYSTAVAGITGEGGGMDSSTADYASYSVSGLYDNSCDDSLVTDLKAQWEIHREEGAGNIQARICLFSKGFATGITNALDGTSQDGAVADRLAALTVAFAPADDSADTFTVTVESDADCALTVTDRVDAS